jgi:hypothetical protein
MILDAAIERMETYDTVPDSCETKWISGQKGGNTDDDRR